MSGYARKVAAHRCTSPMAELPLLFQKTNQGFRLTILLENQDTLSFIPSFSRFQVEIVKIIDNIVKAVKSFKRIERLLKPNFPCPDPLLKVFKLFYWYMVLCKYVETFVD